MSPVSALRWSPLAFHALQRRCSVPAKAQACCGPVSRRVGSSNGKLKSGGGVKGDKPCRPCGYGPPLDYASRLCVVGRMAGRRPLTPLVTRSVRRVPPSGGNPAKPVHGQCFWPRLPEPHGKVRRESEGTQRLAAQDLAGSSGRTHDHPQGRQRGVPGTSMCSA